jgi:hypothetical protein
MLPGSCLNLINIVIAENEEDSPFKPFSVRKDFKSGENIMRLFEGWGVLSSKNWKYQAWAKEMNYPQTIKNIFNDQDLMFGAFAVLSPPIANFVKDAGYGTIEEFKEWLLNPAEGQRPHFRDANQIEIIVAGGSNNNYYSIGGFRYLNQSVRIDEWR